jgi:transposase
MVRALTAKLNANSTNSSIPPSANPPGAPKLGKKKRSKKRRGGQPGHPPHMKTLLPSEQVTRTETIVPDACERCQTTLPCDAGPDDPEPKRFQVIELPPIVVDVTEYQAHGRTCPCCGHLTQAAIPAAARAHSVGPRLTAAMSYLSGCHGMSKRAVEEAVENLFGASIALGTVANLEQEVSVALEQAHEEALEAVRQAEVKFADETSWKVWGKLHWLWTAATTGVVAFVIHAKRGAEGLMALLGENIRGILHSDRWPVYRLIPSERRQICWAHLKRDFQKILDGGGPSVFVGRRGLRLVTEIFAAWHAFQEGQITRRTLQNRIEPLKHRMGRTLIEGGLGADARVAKFCENILELEDALWLFTQRDAVEPTNNFMERMLRLAVLWRKRSFGCNSESGCRFVERVLTVVQTCRLQGRNTLQYLHDAVRSHRQGSACPKLIG